ncbi:hypothetical protein SEA_EESA_27 [Arthrobacter phage Eesa]|nr:hypothetical protein SEA_EESA_27 [Arthrobacter phage Eesa]
MDTYTTTTASGRNVELEIVQAAPYGFAVNFHQMDACAGKVYFSVGGYRATAGELELTLQDGEKELGTFADKMDALAAIVANLDAYLNSADTDTPHDPADADALLMDALDPEVYGDHYGPAARRDVLRRAAYDMGITDRRARPEQLPLIAARAVTMIRNEMAPMLLEAIRQDLADDLAAAGWSATDRAATAFRQDNGRGYVALNFSADTITAYLPNDERFTVRTAETSGTRLARIITAYTD